MTQWIFRWFNVWSHRYDHQGQVVLNPIIVLDTSRMIFQVLLLKVKKVA